MLHKNILDFLFKYKNEVTSKFNNIHWAFKLEHISITILNKDNKIIILSSTPSMEYNLITQELWQYDKSFFPKLHQDSAFFLWDEACTNGYNEAIKKIKETRHGYTLGFCLTRKMEDEHLVYSFATRSKEENIVDYYKNHKNELLLVGDHGYKLIYNIYEKCNSRTNTINLNNKIEKNYLKLIFSNTK